MAMEHFVDRRVLFLSRRLFYCTKFQDIDNRISIPSCASTSSNLKSLALVDSIIYYLAIIFSRDESCGSRYLHRQYQNMEESFPEPYHSNPLAASMSRQNQFHTIWCFSAQCKDSDASSQGAISEMIEFLVVIL